MKENFMIDLETMGFRPTSAIVSIGICHFDAENILDRFYTPISLSDGLALGCTTDPSTIEWWNKQLPSVRAAWQTPDAPTLLSGLSSMTKWIQTKSSKGMTCPWGNGADFDLVLLKHAYDKLEADPPWEFYNHRCFRTVKSLFEVAPLMRRGAHHNALDDAEYQTQWLQRILAVHKIKLT